MFSCAILLSPDRACRRILKLAGEGVDEGWSYLGMMQHPSLRKLEVLLPEVVRMLQNSAAI